MRIRACALRAAISLAAMTGALALAAPAASAAAVSAGAGHGWLRLAHLSPSTPAVDVYLYSFGDPKAMVVLKHVGYGTVSPYERVASGDSTVAMRAAGAAPDSKPVLSTSADVAAGNAHTVPGTGPDKGLRLQVMHDQLTAPAGKALVQLPAGPAATGFGGTAPQPGAPLLPWLGTAACGLLMAAVGLATVRRPRRRTGPAHARSARTGSAHARSAHARSVHAGSAHAGSAHAGSAHAGSAHARSVHARSAHAGSAHARSVHARSARAGSAHARSAHAGSAGGTSALGQPQLPPAPLR